MTTETFELTGRQQRELEYYEKYSTSFDANQILNFEPVTSKSKRPWNSYWSVFHLAEKCFEPGDTLLDFGSGPGVNALMFAQLGYEVEGFDISESNVYISQKLAEKYDLDKKAFFLTCQAEKLVYPDNHFNFIAGIDILHHVDIEKAMKECRRVLKSGGVAVFREPIEVPFFDKVRNCALVRFFFPNNKSFELHITEDERKLNENDLKIIRSVFPRSKFKRFTVLSRLDRFFRKESDPTPSFLEKMDYFLIRHIPFLKNFGGGLVIFLRKE